MNNIGITQEFGDIIFLLLLFLAAILLLLAGMAFIADLLEKHFQDDEISIYETDNEES
jgi:hypothetical protein